MTISLSEAQIIAEKRDRLTIYIDEKIIEAVQSLITNKASMAESFNVSINLSNYEGKNRLITEFLISSYKERGWVVTIQPRQDNEDFTLVLQPTKETLSAEHSVNRKAPYR